MKIFYLQLEPLEARYTKQLCEEWFPEAIHEVDPTVVLHVVGGEAQSTEIKTGTVLDATGRGIYACTQVASLLSLIRGGVVIPGDVIFLQDFWTPGFEAVPYALHLHGLKSVRIFSMLHAQSVDEYDFTWDMRHWMRPIEVGLSRIHTAVFVGSTVHKEQLRAAGFECPIHVIGLPIDAVQVRRQMDRIPVPPTSAGLWKNVCYSSRLDWEKNPDFMVAVAEGFLKDHPEWTWTVCTSGKEIRSNDPISIIRLRALAQANGRFIIREGLTKDQYYGILKKSHIQFNCSLQDYVSWTLLEAAAAECLPVYPNFRSFPELLDPVCLYKAFEVKDALRVLFNAVQCQEGDSSGPTKRVLEMSDLGRNIQAKILCGQKDAMREVNVWLEQNIS